MKFSASVMASLTLCSAVFLQVLSIAPDLQDSTQNRSASQLYFHQEAYMIPHPDKAHRGGEDAFYSDQELLVIADGVGGWNNYGVDPSKFSRFLCTRAGELFHSPKKQSYRESTVELIAESASANNNIGSSTMVVLTIQGEDTLKTCFLGDSGFAIFRRPPGESSEYEILFEFKEQQHSFNFPFQLALKKYNGDDPYLSICEDFKIQRDDIIIVGSDGLFDNIYVTEMLDLIRKSGGDEQRLFSIKQRLSKLAIQRGQDQGFFSPFAQRAKQLGIEYEGGKLDDTTIIVAKVKQGPYELSKATETIDFLPDSVKKQRSDIEVSSL